MDNSEHGAEDTSPELPVPIWSFTDERESLATEKKPEPGNAIAAAASDVIDSVAADVVEAVFEASICPPLASPDSHLDKVILEPLGLSGSHHIYQNVHTSNTQGLWFKIKSFALCKLVLVSANYCGSI